MALRFGKNLHELNLSEAVGTVNNRSFMYYVHVCGEIQASHGTIDESSTRNPLHN